MNITNFPLLKRADIAEYLRVNPGSMNRSLQTEWVDMPFERKGKRGDRYFSIPRVIKYLEKKFN